MDDNSRQDAASSQDSPSHHQPDQVRGNLGANPSHQSRQSLPKRPNAPFFARAAQPEIIRAHQKDLYYLVEIKDQIEEVLRTIKGTRWLQAFASEVTLASACAYFGLTTLLGSQTLGEEYVDILQYDSISKKLPTFRKRAILLTFHILTPYILSRLYSRARRRLLQLRENPPPAIQLSQSASTDDLFSDGPQKPVPPAGYKPPSLWRRLELWVSQYELPSFDSLSTDHIRAIHLATFYLFGRYYHVAKRLVSIQFLSTQARSPSANSNTKPPSYEVLGALMAIQLAVRIAATVRERRKARLAAMAPALNPSKDQQAPMQPPLVDGIAIDKLTFDAEDPNAAEPEGLEREAPKLQEAIQSEDSQARRCTLCLSTRKDPSATQCGHVFCWECIVGWSREKAECPLCRQAINMSRILPLYNL